MKENMKKEKKDSNSSWITFAVVVVVAIIAAYFGYMFAFNGSPDFAPQSIGSVDAADSCPNPTSSVKVCKGESYCVCAGANEFVLDLDDGSCPANYDNYGVMVKCGAVNVGSVTKACEISGMLSKDPDVCSNDCLSNGVTYSVSRDSKCCQGTQERNCVPE